MKSASVNVVVEGDSDEALARKILDLVGFSVDAVYVQGGKGRLDKKLSAFNHAAEYSPWFVLRDLDQDADCAPELVAKLLPERADRMCFRISVHAAESWLLADRKNMSQFLGVPLSKIAAQPDALADPKTELVNLARKSRKKQIRADMVPRPNSTTRVGPAYVSRMIEFANIRWNPRRASQNSESLAKCLVALDEFKQTLS